MERPFLDSDRVAEFWNNARKKADEEQQTGYLEDEWPPAVGMNRFRGEWAQVARWLDRWQVPRGACLDVGCGVGVWLERLAARFDTVHGIDLSSEMVASARARMAKLGLANVTVERQGLTDLPDDRVYDLIFIGGVLMYLNDDALAAVVTKLRRMLSPRGLLVLRESTSTGAIWYRDKPLSPGLFADPKEPRPPYFCIYRPAPSYRAMLDEAGLRVLRSRPNRHYTLVDLTESLLRAVNKLLRGRLARRRGSAERVARWLHRLRFVLLYPPYYLLRALAPRTWRVTNTWYLASSPASEPAPPSAPPAARSS